MLEKYSALGAAVSWGAELLTGLMSTSIAAMAVAWLGLSMLRGDIVWREGLRVVMGCFILFGAPLIARRLTSIVPASFGEVLPSPETRSVGSDVRPVPPPQHEGGDPFNPYAGRINR